MSSAPKALPSLFLQLREERAISKGASEAAGGGRKAQAGNSFPEAPRPWFVVTMSAGRVAGPGASRGTARETVSALRPVATLPCPVGPSSWRHLHEISRTRRSGCGERHRRLVKAPGAPPTHTCPSLRPRRRIQHGERQAGVPAPPPPPEASSARASPESGASPSGADPVRNGGRTCPVCRAPPSPRLSGWGTPPRSRRSLFPPPFSFPHHRKRRRQ